MEGFYDEEDDQSAASLPTLSSGVGPRKAAAKPFDLVAAKEVGFGQEGGGGETSGSSTLAGILTVCGTTQGHWDAAAVIGGEAGTYT